MFFWNAHAFLMIQWMLAIWSLCPLPFGNPAWTSGISWFTHCWSLAWGILNIMSPACEMNAIVQSLTVLWHGISLGLEWKVTFFSPVATAEFSIFADILSAALSQHHLLGFEISEQKFHPSPPLALFIVILPKALLTSHYKMSGSRWLITSL